MTRKRVTPRTNRQNIRAIGRKQESFNRGMISDVEPLDIPLNSVALLKNARGHNNAIKGATGTKEWLTGLELPRIHDGLTVTLDGDQLTVDTPIVDPNAIGYIVHATDPADNSQTLFFIVDTANGAGLGTVAIVEYDTNKYVNPTGKVFTDAYVVGKINARHYDPGDRTEYILMGRLVFYRDIDETTWSMYTNPDLDKVVNAQSMFFKIRERVVLVNSGGAFVLTPPYSEQQYMYLANGDLPDYPLDKQTETKSANPSAYRYLYGYMKQSGDFTLNRNDTSTFTEIETPPFLWTTDLESVAADSFTPYRAEKDYSQYKLQRPIDDTFYYEYEILDTAYLDYKAWKALTEDNKNPYFYIEYDGVSQKIFLNFSTVENLNDVAESFELALVNSVDANFRVKYDFDTTDRHWFEIYNTDASITWQPVSSIFSFNGNPYYTTEFPDPETELNYVLVTSTDEKNIGSTVSDGTRKYVIDGVDNTVLGGQNAYVISPITTLRPNLINRHSTSYRKGLSIEDFSGSDYTVNAGSPTFGAQIVEASTIDVTLNKDIRDVIQYSEFKATAMLQSLNWYIYDGVSAFPYWASVNSSGDVTIDFGTYQVSENVPAFANNGTTSMRVITETKTSGTSTIGVRIKNGTTVKDYTGSSSITITSAYKFRWILPNNTTSVIQSTTLADIASTTEYQTVVKHYTYSQNVDFITYFDAVSGVDTGDIISTENESLVYVSDTSSTPSAGFSFSNSYYNQDSFGDVGLDGAGILQNDTTQFKMGTIVKTFRYPKERYDITHYSLYRTKDIYPLTLEPPIFTDARSGNNPEIYAWVEDIPVVVTFSGILNDSTRTITVTGDADVSLIGTRLSIIDSVTVLPEIIDVVGSVYYLGFGGIPTGISTKTFYAGTEDAYEGSVDASGVITSLHAFSESDEGKLLFWADGSTGVISDVTSGVATTTNTNPKASQVFMLNPTTRSYYDTMSDVTLNGNLRVYSLGSRFYDKLPSANIATYADGLLMTATKDSNIINYTGTEKFEQLGYHHPLYERNDSIEEGIRCMFTVNDLMCILTTSSTFSINPKNVQVLEDTEFGEFYLNLGEPFEVHKSIGTTHQFKWKYGEKGDIGIITNEPALRFFNGHSYGKNLADGLIQNTELQRMDDIMILAYSSQGGIHIWGTKK